jgi:hypothetical protein
MEEPVNRDYPIPWFEEPGYLRRVARLESACLAGGGKPLWNLDPHSRLQRKTYGRRILRRASMSLGSLLQLVLGTITSLGILLTERIFGGHRLSEDHG